MNGKPEPRDADDVIRTIREFLAENFNCAIGGGDDELYIDFEHCDIRIRVTDNITWAKEIAGG